MAISMNPPPKERILIAGYSVRALAESAVNAGYAVRALDNFGDQDLRALAQANSLREDFSVHYSPAALYEAGRRLGCPAIIYTSNLENYPEIISRFAADRRLIGNSPHALWSVRDWKNLFYKLRQAEFPIPETACACTECPSDPNARWLIKPVLSGGGHGVSYYQGEPFDERKSILQRYLPGKSCSASFVANGADAVVIGISQQLVGVPQFGVQDFRYCGSILPLPEMLDPAIGYSILKQTRRIASFLAREFGLTGVNGFDFILNNDRVQLIEVNPRYAASMELIERAYGLSIFHMHFQAAAECRLPDFALESGLLQSGFLGKCILFSDRNASMPESLNWREWDMRDVPAPGEKMHAGSPICTLFASRPDHAGVLNALIRKTEDLKKIIYDRNAG
jgi:uncharacterized protein